MSAAAATATHADAIVVDDAAPATPTPAAKVTKKPVNWAQVIAGLLAGLDLVPTQDSDIQTAAYAVAMEEKEIPDVDGCRETVAPAQLRQCHKLHNGVLCTRMAPVLVQSMTLDRQVTSVHYCSAWKYIQDEEERTVARFKAMSAEERTVYAKRMQTAKELHVELVRRALGYIAKKKSKGIANYPSFFSTFAKNATNMYLLANVLDDMLETVMIKNKKTKAMEPVKMYDMTPKLANSYQNAVCAMMLHASSFCDGPQPAKTDGPHVVFWKNMLKDFKDLYVIQNGRKAQTTEQCAEGMHTFYAKCTSFIKGSLLTHFFPTGIQTLTTLMPLMTSIRAGAFADVGMGVTAFASEQFDAEAIRLNVDAVHEGSIEKAEEVLAFTAREKQVLAVVEAARVANKQKEADRKEKKERAEAEKKKAEDAATFDGAASMFSGGEERTSEEDDEEDDGTAAESSHVDEVDAAASTASIMAGGRIDFDASGEMAVAPPRVVALTPAAAAEAPEAPKTPSKRTRAAAKEPKAPKEPRAPRARKQPAPKKGRKSAADDEVVDSD